MLDNPVWSALSGPHRSLAGRLHNLLWYPPAMAPFVAIPAADVQPDLESAYACGLGRQAYFVGKCPDSLPETRRMVSRSQILQLFPTGEIPEVGEDAGTVLGEIDSGAMRELTQIAFPDFFRERTAELGVYLGVFAGEKNRLRWRANAWRCPGCKRSAAFAPTLNLPVKATRAA